MKSKIIRTVSVIFLLCAAFTAAAPVIITAGRALYGDVGVWTDLILWKPKYIDSLARSIIISALSALGSVLVSVPAAYVLAKGRIHRRGRLLYIYVFLLLTPYQIIMLPQYMVVKSLDLYDTIGGLILTFIFYPLTAFLIAQTMKSIPDDIIDAARLDTSSEMTIAFRIAAPAARPGVICAALLTFTETWNAVSEPLTLISSEDLFPAAVVIGAGEPDQVAFAAASLFILIPLIVYNIFDEEILDGLKNFRLK